MTTSERELCLDLRLEYPQGFFRLRINQDDISRFTEIGSGVNNRLYYWLESNRAAEEFAGDLRSASDQKLAELAFKAQIAFEESYSKFGDGETFGEWQEAWDIFYEGGQPFYDRCVALTD